MNETLSNIVENFVFIRPLWLLGILPVIFVYALKLKFGQHQNLWQQILPHHLYQTLVIKKGLGKPSRYIHMAALAWLASMFAIAGPSWEKLPQAVYQTQAGKVILMDMSMSMRATDLSPNRLTRSRFKAIDLIEQLSEGETGLVAYAGDAFVISPLTDDAATLVNLIPSLSPEIMPTQGSDPLTGLERAAELLETAGYQTGHIYWLTDGITPTDINELRGFIQGSAYSVSALLIGTEQGAPITLIDGTLLKDNKGSIVVPSINSDYMHQVFAGTRANFRQFTSDNTDIMGIKQSLDFAQQQQAEQVEDASGDTLKDMGPYFLLLILPIAAYAFRRGIMMIASIAVTSSIVANVVYVPTTMAQEDITAVNEENTAERIITENVNSFTQKLLKNKNQRAKLAYDQGDYEQANALFEDTQWKAASAYKSGDFESAAALYNQLDGVENEYNKGNALAKAMKLEEALEAYTNVLSAQPDHANALKNKDIIEQMLQQQEENKQDGDDGQKGEDQDESEQSDQQNSEQENKEGDDTDEQSSDNQEQNSDPSSEDGEPKESDNKEQSKQDQADDSDLKEQAEQEKQQNNAQNEQEQQENNEQDAQNTDINQEKESNEQAEQQEAISQADMQQSNLTPEEQEEMQRLQMILNKVPDDPAYLLQRKMQLEAHRRKKNPLPPTEENW